MIEVSITEIALFVWAMFATVMWLHTAEELRGARRMIRAMIEDSNVRNKIVGAYQEHVKAKEQA